MTGLKLGLGLGVSEAVGGGGPEWLPDGALFHADFDGVHYWDGTAEVLPAEFLENFDEGQIAGGFYIPASDTSIIGNSLLPFIDTGGFTVVVDGEFTAGFFTALSLRDGFSHQIDVYTDEVAGVILEEGEDFTTVQSDVAYTTFDPMKFAVTLIPTKMTVSDRGSAAFTVALTPEAHWFVWSVFLLRGGATNKFKTITSYSPLSDAALQALTT